MRGNGNFSKINGNKEILSKVKWDYFQSSGFNGTGKELRKKKGFFGTFSLNTILKENLAETPCETF